MDRKGWQWVIRQVLNLLDANRERDNMHEAMQLGRMIRRRLLDADLPKPVVRSVSYRLMRQTRHRMKGPSLSFVDAFEQTIACYHGQFLTFPEFMRALSAAEMRGFTFDIDAEAAGFIAMLDERCIHGVISCALLASGDRLSRIVGMLEQLACARDAVANQIPDGQVVSLDVMEHVLSLWAKCAHYETALPTCWLLACLAPHYGLTMQQIGYFVDTFGTGRITVLTELMKARRGDGSFVLDRALVQDALLQSKVFQTATVEVMVQALIAWDRDDRPRNGLVAHTKTVAAATALRGSGHRLLPT